MARTKHADVVIPDFLPKCFKLATEVFLRFWVDEGALAAWYRMPRKFGGALLETAELNLFKREGLSRHSQLIVVVS